ncbi:MAG TPA: methyltransferase domain-containing protein [Alphaproteobacteria bacterium]|nr:methyltransferase domain-containing protein [Alphaproteobacteria bacterium]
MVHEASKTNKLRGPDFFKTYLQGQVLDIGAGKSPVTPTAKVFDKAQGDAERMPHYMGPNSYDCVHSSHCLEHMSDVPAALADWWSLVKPGGYLIFVVPDEDLYEQGAWPSLFNDDHKATFRLGGTASWSPVSFEVRQLAEKLPGGEIIQIRRMDAGYDERYRLKSISRGQRTAYNLLWPFSGGLQYVLGNHAPSLYPLYKFLHLPIDQTIGPALAQIEVILRKSPREPT